MTAAKHPPKRASHQHGQGFVAKALPYLLERVADITPRRDAHPPERAARQWHREVGQDQGGELAATKRALLDAARPRQRITGWWSESRSLAQSRHLTP
jgi:hypothetical protein